MPLFVLERNGELMRRREKRSSNTRTRETMMMPILVLDNEPTLHSAGFLCQSRVAKDEADIIRLFTNAVSSGTDWTRVRQLRAL